MEQTNTTGRPMTPEYQARCKKELGIVAFILVFGVAIIGTGLTAYKTGRNDSANAEHEQKDRATKTYNDGWHHGREEAILEQRRKEVRAEISVTKKELPYIAKTAPVVLEPRYHIGYGDLTEKRDAPEQFAPIRNQPIQVAQRPRPGTEEKWEVPKEGSLYVWQTPEKGFQSVIVLKAVEGDTLEAAILVPLKLRVYGIDADAKNANDVLDKLVGGKLANASFRGKDKWGRTLADIWLGDPDPKQPDAPSGWLSEYMVKQKVGKTWKDGPKPPEEK